MLRAIAICAILSTTLTFLTAASAADQPPYEVNAIVSATGALAFAGQSVTKTLRVVETVVNRQGGIRGRPLKFVIADDGSSPQVAVQLLTKLISEKVPVVLGPGYAATCSAGYPLAQANGPVMWCTSPGIYPPAGSYAFAAGVTTDDTVLVMFRFLRAHGWKRVAAFSTNDAVGQVFDRGVAYSMAFPENKDIHLVAHEYMNPTDLSIGAQAARIKAANPDVILTLAAGTPWGTMMRGIADAGMSVPIIGSNGNVSYAQLGQYRSFLPTELYFPAVIGLVPNGVGAGPIKDVQAAYFAAFKEAGIKPDLLYNSPWDPAMLLVTALREIGPEATAQQIRDYLVKLHGWAGVNGIYDFRDGKQRGIGQQAILIYRYDNVRNEFIPVSRPGGALQ